MTDILQHSKTLFVRDIKEVDLVHQDSFVDLYIYFYDNRLLNLKSYTCFKDCSNELLRFKQCFDTKFMLPDFDQFGILIFDYTVSSGSGAAALGKDYGAFLMNFEFNLSFINKLYKIDGVDYEE